MKGQGVSGLGKEGDKYIDLWSDMISLSGPLDQFHEVQTTIQRFLCAAQKTPFIQIS